MTSPESWSCSIRTGAGPCSSGAAWPPLRAGGTAASSGGAVRSCTWCIMSATAEEAGTP